MVGDSVGAAKSAAEKPQKRVDLSVLMSHIVRSQTPRSVGTGVVPVASKVKSFKGQHFGLRLGEAP